MKNFNICGWLLLALGLVMIFWALISSYNIFTGKSDAPEFFKLEETLRQNGRNEFSLDQNNIEEEMERMLEEQMAEIFSGDVFSEILNLIVWSMLAGIFIFGGAQISGIGVKLLKISLDQEKNS